MSKRFILLSFLATIFLYIYLLKLYINGLQGNVDIYIVNLSHVFVFYFVLLFAFQKEVRKEFYLIVILFVVNLLYVGLYNYLYFQHTGMFFEFTGSDSMPYHRQAMYATQFGYFEGIANFINPNLRGHSIGDTGMIMYLSLLYRIIEHPLFPRFVNIILNIITTLLLFRIAKHYTDRKIAFIFSLAYGIASFTLYFVSSGLKETIFTLWVVLVYYYYFKFCRKQNKRFIILILFYSLTLVFFRIPVAIFALLSIGFSEIFKRGLTVRKVVLSFVFLLILAFVVITYQDRIFTYMLTNTAIQGYVGGNIFVQATNFLSAFIGPLPTIIPVIGKDTLSMYAGTLILKSFISIFFMYSIYFVIKERRYFLMAMMLMCLFTIVGLISTNSAFKTRYVVPYLPLFFILCAYSYEVLKTNKRYRILDKSIFPINLIIFCLIFLWNTLRL